MTSGKMLRRAEKLAAKNQSQPAKSPFHIVWLSGATRLVNFTVQRVVCHHKTSLNLKLRKKLQYHVVIASCIITLRSVFHSLIRSLTISSLYILCTLANTTYTKTIYSFVTRTEIQLHAQPVLL